jgi:hypothetical protein
MEDLKKRIEKEIEKIWPEAKKSLTKTSKDLKKMMEISEKKFTQLLSQTKKKTEELIAKTKREELYYELGKNIVSLLTSDQLKNKNVLRIYAEIRRLNKRLRTLK